MQQFIICKAINSKIRHLPVFMRVAKQVIMIVLPFQRIGVQDVAVSVILQGFSFVCVYS